MTISKTFFLPTFYFNLIDYMINFWEDKVEKVGFSIVNSHSVPK